MHARVTGTGDATHIALLYAMRRDVEFYAARQNPTF